MDTHHTIDLWSDTPTEQLGAVAVPPTDTS